MAPSRGRGRHANGGIVENNNGFPGRSVSRFQRIDCSTHEPPQDPPAGHRRVASRFHLSR